MRVQWRKRGVIVWGLVVAALCAAGGAALWAAQPSDRPTVDASMNSLVLEIRALREAVERSGVVATQAQLLLGRVQLQENRLVTLARQSQDARDRLAVAEREQSGPEYELKRLTNELNSGRVPAEERETLANDRIPALKQQLREAQMRTQQLRSQEAAASSALAEEQSRWVDFNGRLEALERSLAAMAASRVRP
jgi:chromosome segregation ATPase